jgi:hypothetical protein
MGDMTDIANEMGMACDEAENRGLDMREWGDFDFPEDAKPRVALAMDHWETGCYHLHMGRKMMLEIAKEVEPDGT